MSARRFPGARPCTRPNSSLSSASSAAAPRLARRARRWPGGSSLCSARIASSGVSPATLLAALVAYYSIRLAFQSWQFNDISTGNDATPLWIPQLAMAAGTLVLLIAILDELVLEWTGRRGRTISDAALDHE